MTKSVSQHADSPSRESQQPPEPLKMASLILREHRSFFWRLYVPAGTPVEHLEDPATFSILSGKINIHDSIEAIWTDRSRFVELIVLSAGAGQPVHCQILRNLTLRKIDATNYDGCPRNHQIVQDSVTGRWGAIRLSDRVMIVTDKPDRRIALRELQDHASLRGS